MTIKNVARAIAIGFGLGLLITVPALMVAIVSGGAGHGDYAAARLLFPFSMLLTLVDGRIGVPSIMAALLQFPIYGALVARSIALSGYRSIALLALVHAIAASVCFAGTLPNFS